MAIIDISPRLSPRLAVFPGDTPLSREVLLDMKAGAPLTLSTIRATVHLGAHVDGPNHYGADARPIDRQPLDLYVGPCRVLRVAVPPRHRVRRSDLEGPIDAERILIATGTYPDPEQWNDDFAALDPALVDDLHAEGVRLVGIDTPSVDTADSKDLASHQRFLANDMAILEGIVLTDVAPGRYELIALPLALEGFDASPVRAVLRGRGE
ncbi:MAG: cyclase family protein [Phycisphaerales bacterium]|nr:cyclase family protein [Phycisphaerales bacterium]